VLAQNPKPGYTRQLPYEEHPHEFWPFRQDQARPPPDPQGGGHPPRKVLNDVPVESTPRPHSSLSTLPLCTATETPPPILYGGVEATRGRHQASGRSTQRREKELYPPPLLHCMYSLLLSSILYITHNLVIANLTTSVG